MLPGPAGTVEDGVITAAAAGVDPEPALLPVPAAGRCAAGGDTGCMRCLFATLSTPLFGSLEPRPVTARVKCSLSQNAEGSQGWVCLRHEVEASRLAKLLKISKNKNSLCLVCGLIM